MVHKATPFVKPYSVSMRLRAPFQRGSKAAALEFLHFRMRGHFMPGGPGGPVARTAGVAVRGPSKRPTEKPRTAKSAVRAT